MTTFESLGVSTVILIGVVFLIVLAICWFVMPFILLRQNVHMKRQILEQQQTNALLREMAQAVKPQPAVPRGLDALMRAGPLPPV